MLLLCTMVIAVQADQDVRQLKRSTENLLNDYVSTWKAKVSEIRNNSLNFFGQRKQSLQNTVDSLAQQVNSIQDEYKFSQIQTKLAQVAYENAVEGLNLALSKGWVQSADLQARADEAKRNWDQSQVLQNTKLD